jgi:hypothetical protein
MGRAVTRRRFLVGLETRVDCGDDDVFAGVCRDLVHAVPGATGGVRAGYHDDATWRSFVPDQLEFIRSRVGRGSGATAP